jgi:hypothetical protein
MAAGGAKFGHCQNRLPVEYRAKSPFHPEIYGSLDFGVRVERIYEIDRELDRAVLSVDDYEQLLVHDIGWGRGPGGAFAAEDPAALLPRSGIGRRRAPSVGPARRQFLLNALRIAGETSRFQPPWTDALVEEVHSVLLARTGAPVRSGGLRREPYAARGPDGEVVYYACPPGRIRPELQGLLEWVDRVGPTLIPVIPATVLVQGLHSIRPFPEGNMTVARTLATLYLRHHGLPNAELASIAPSAMATPAVFLRLLLWTEATGSYSELVDYMLDATLAGYTMATGRWLAPGRDTASPPLDEVGTRLLSRARRTPGWFSAADASAWVAGRSDPTVLRHLNGLVRSGLLESLGQTRAKRYRLVSSRAILPELRDRLESAGTARAAGVPAGRRRTVIGRKVPATSPTGGP